MARINAQIRALEDGYGKPLVEQICWLATPFEFSLLERGGRARGRAHDITLLIFKDDNVAVIRKPSYPPDIWRPPSGGIEPTETFEEGAVREAYEETGLCVQLREYLVRAEVVFQHAEQSGETMTWTTHVFLADWRSGEPHAVDTKEIAEARWATRRELEFDLQERLDSAPTHGLRYRGWVQRKAFEALQRRRE